MRSLLHQTRLTTGLLFLIPFARIEGSSLPPIAFWQDRINQRQSREIEAEVAQLAAQLRSGDAEKRRDAVMRLSRLDGDAATSALTSALADALPGVRALVLAGLGERTEAKVVTPIAARLTSEKDPFVRRTAAYALAGFSGFERSAALVAALKDKDQEVRGAAAVSLGDHADSAAVAPLVVALSDKSAFVRAHSARALGVNGSNSATAVPSLVRLLNSDPDNEVKRQSATALGSIGDRSALPALERASRDNDSYLAQAARDSIRMIEGTK